MKKQAKIIEMSSNRVTTKELKLQIDQIQEQSLVHIHDCIHRLEDNVKDNRKYFEDRLNRLDNRIYWVLGLVVTTLLTVMGALISRAM